MMGLSNKSSLMLLTITLAAALCLFFAPAYVWGQTGETIVFDNANDASMLDEPQEHFGFSTGRNSPMPATPNSLFPTSSSKSNTVTVSGNVYIPGHVFGGIAEAFDEASTDNVVTISNATIGSASAGGNVFGGWALDGKTGHVKENKITIGTGSVINGIVFGGWIRGDVGQIGTAGGDAYKNIVTIAGGELRDNVYGAYVQTGGGTLSYNEVTISGGELEMNTSRGGILAGAYSSLATNNVDHNKVTITGGTIAGRNVSDPYAIYGGRGQAGSAITNNEVIVNGNAALNVVAIYGGQNSSGSGAVTDNKVTLNGGKITGVIYGGHSVSGAATDNEVNLGSGTFSGDIYGGYSRYGKATDNTVTVNGATLINNVRLYGGSTGSGGDAFTGNKLDKKSAVYVSEARNFQFVTFEGYGDDGKANIGFLDTTASGSSQSGVTITTGAHDITFEGRIWGSGDLTMKAGSNKFIITDNNNDIWHQNGVKIESGTLQLGDGRDIGEFKTPQFQVSAGATLAYKHSNNVTFEGKISGGGTLEQAGTNQNSKLILTGDSNVNIGLVNVTSGTLQLGNGGTSGSLTTTKYDVAANAILAYNRSNTATDGNQVTGAGKVVQRGSGTLVLTNAGNSFTGGTEIESGTLLIAATDTYNKTANASGSKQGYITFTNSATGADKTARVAASGDISLTNSFRTASGAGANNSVDMISNGRVVTIANNDLADNGGAFYVADGTAMTVTADNLRLESNKGAAGNDLYVGNGGTFNLKTRTSTLFASGIDGGGDLYLRPEEGGGPYAMVWMVNRQNTSQTYKMGTTTVEGSAGKSMALHLERSDATDTSTQARVLFDHTGDFKVGNNAVLIGEGTVESDTSITIAPTDSGYMAGIYPHITDLGGFVDDAPGTIKLVAPTIKLDNFVMGYAVGTPSAANGPTQNPLQNESSFVTSKNSLLDFTTTQGGSTKTVDLGEGVIFIRTVSNNPFKKGDYLIMRSDNGFTGGVDALKNLTVSFDGFTLSTDASKGMTARGGNDLLELKLGADPNTSSGAYTSGSDKNIWLTTEMNSLSMTWNGDSASASAKGGAWESGNRFESEQIENNLRESHFLPGDKVYVSNDGEAKIELPSFDPFKMEGFGITVSGLVIGKTTEGVIAEKDASYTFSGAGGMTADETSAHGKYVDTNTGDKDDEPIDTGTNQDGDSISDILKPTGKLEKFGENTLTFLNTGMNMFTKGIDLYGGTTRFTADQQLVDGSYDKTGLSKGYGTHFKDEATLEALSNAELHNAVTIEQGVTATFSAAEGAEFIHLGDLIESSSGTGVLNKSGAGVVTLAALGDDYVSLRNSNFAGRMTVNEGILNVVGSYKSADVEVRATLSGTGFLKTGRIFVNGTLHPGKIEEPLTFTGEQTFDEGSHFVVSLENTGNNPRSEYIVVEGETTIEHDAILNVLFDYWNSPANLTGKGDFDAVYRIIEAQNAPANTTTKFELGDISSLPRGVSLEQGWDIGPHKTTTADGDYEYQLMLVRDKDNGVDDVPGQSHNENEIGKIVDNMLDDDPHGPMQEIVQRVTDGGLTDDEVNRNLNELTGDLAANALFLAFKEPWRHPFNRLDRGGPAAPSAGYAHAAPRLWFEYTSRYEETDSDGNAHDFTIERYGAALGLDYQVSPRLTLGGNLQFTHPTLKQDTGEVTADDLELGVYGLAEVADNWDMKTYLGYSWQNYDFDREVYLPPTKNNPTAFHERLDGDTSGHAVAASIELIRHIDMEAGYRLSPVVAVDYEKAWLDAFTETGGLAALVYGETEMESLMLRAGVLAEHSFREGVTMKGRLQYSRQMLDENYPGGSLYFASDAKARRADIRGLDAGRDYLNLGLGADIAVGDRENSRLYLNYDGKFGSRTSIHAAEGGLMILW